MQVEGFVWGVKGDLRGGQYGNTGEYMRCSGSDNPAPRREATLVRGFLCAWCNTRWAF